MIESWRKIIYFSVCLCGGVISDRSALFANPSNPTIVAGDASFSTPSAVALEITASDRSIISWEGFSIASQESTRFVLPDVSSVVLNRVTSSQMSELNGMLSSNGTVYLINPNGVLIGPNGTINTAGFLASTLDVDNQQFINAGDLTFSGDSAASIVNKGMITGWNGDVILMAYQVENTNTIQTAQGITAIGCAEQILLTPTGDQRITIQIPTIRPKDPSASFGIHQMGTIQAIQAELKADGNPYAYAIKNEGWVNATGVNERQGRIILLAPDGLTSSSGILSAVNANDSGGEIQVLGKVVTLTDKAEVYTSSAGNGGTILIGGDYQGSNPDILNAQTTFVDSNVLISANSLQQGNGGRVITWADGSTIFYGKVNAKGGSLGGNGGFAEISGVGDLDFQGTVNLTAPRGSTGTLLLDPSNIAFTAAAGNTNIATTGCIAGTDAYTTTPVGAGGNSAVVSIPTLLAVLDTCNVTIVTTPGGTQAGTVTVSSPINWAPGVANTHTLTVTSASTMTISAAVTNNTTGGSMTWNSGAATSIAAAVTNGPTVGAPVLGEAPVITFDSVGTITMTAAGSITNNSDSGTINLMTSAAASDITCVAGSSVTNSSISGAINLTAPGSGGDVNAEDITNSSTSGSINLTAGLDIDLNGAITNSSTGSINLTADRDINIRETIINSPSSGAVIANAGRDIDFETGAGFTSTSPATSTFIAGISTGGTLATTSTSTITISGGGGLTLQGNDLNGTTAVSLQGPINHNSSGLLLVSPTTTGNIVTGAAAVITATSGPLTFDTTPSGGTITLAGPITFTAAATGAFTVHSQNAASATTGLGLNNTLDYSSTGAVSLMTEIGNILTNATNTSMHFKTGSGDVTASAAGNFTMNAATDLIFDSGAGNLSITAVTGSISLGGTGVTTFNSGAGKSATLMADTALSLNNFTYNATGPLNITSTTGNITLAGTTTFRVGNSSVSGAVTLTATAGSITSSAGSTFHIHDLATSLTMVAGTNITLVSLLYDAPGNCSLTAAGGTITTSGAITFPNTPALSTGGLIMMAETNIATNGTLTYGTGAGALTGTGLTMTTTTGNITTGTAGSIIYTSAEDAQLTANNGAITSSGAITFNSGSGNLTLTTLGVATGDIALNGVTTFIAGAGSLIILANQDFSNAGTITYNSSNPFSITTALGGITINDPVNLATSAALNLTSTTGTININDQVRNTSTGPINATSFGTLSIGTGGQGVPAQLGSAFGDVTIDITGTGDVQVLGGDTLNAYAQIGFDTGDVSSNLIFTKIGGSLILTGGSSNSCYALIGHGSQIGGGTGGTRAGNITFGSAPNPIPGAIDLRGRISPITSLLGVGSFAQIGHVRALTAPPVIATGDIDMRFMTGSVLLAGGNRTGAYALIGDGGVASGQPDSYTGNIQVYTLAGTSGVILNAGLATQAFASIGHTAFVNTPAVNVSITSAITEVISGFEVVLRSQDNTEAVIGGYVSAVEGSGTIAITNLNVQSQNNGSIQVRSLSPSNNFNGSLIGVLAYTGAVPIVAAGSASCNLSIISDERLQVANGNLGTSTNTFALIQNGIGSPAGGPFSTTITAVNAIEVIGGTNIAAIRSIGPLTCTSDASLTVAADLFLGDAEITSMGTTLITAPSVIAVGGLAGSHGLIANTTGDLTVTATGSVTLYGTGSIELTGGSGTLSVSALFGAMAAVNNAFIRNQGLGPTLITGGFTGLLQGGLLGPAFISSNSLLTATFTDDLFLIAASTGTSSILSNGNTTIRADHLSITGDSALFPAMIDNATGDLTITADSIIENSFAEINLLGGSGTLTITALTESISLSTASLIHNHGTGPTEISAVQNLFMISGNSAPSTIITNGDTTITATQLNMSGHSIPHSSSIVVSQGNFSIDADLINMNPHALISLSGGSGLLSVTAAGDLTISNESFIQNLGTGNSTYTIGESASLVGGGGDAGIFGNTGTLTLNIQDNLSLVTNPLGSSVITANGPIVITARNVTLSGLATAEKSLIQTTAGDLLITALNNIGIRDNAAVINLGTGALTLVTDQQTPLSAGSARFILDPDADVTGGGLVYIFTARPNGISTGNLAFGQVNSTFVTTGLSCPFDAPPSSSTQQYNTNFSTFGGGFGTPFTIFYKSSPSPTPVVPSQATLLHELSNVSFTSSEFFVLLRDYTKYYWDLPFFFCSKNMVKNGKLPKVTPFDRYGNNVENRNTQKGAFDSDLFSPGRYPTLRQNWTKYPVYFSEETGCNL